jgi:hypothetical protein
MGACVSPLEPTDTVHQEAPEQICYSVGPCEMDLNRDCFQHRHGVAVRAGTPLTSLLARSTLHSETRASGAASKHAQGRNGPLLFNVVGARLPRWRSGNSQGGNAVHVLNGR